MKEITGKPADELISQGLKVSTFNRLANIKYIGDMTFDKALNALIDIGLECGKITFDINQTETS